MNSELMRIILTALKKETKSLYPKIRIEHHKNKNRLVLKEGSLKHQIAIGGPALDPRYSWRSEEEGVFVQIQTPVIHSYEDGARQTSGGSWKIYIIDTQNIFNNLYDEAQFQKDIKILVDTIEKIIEIVTEKDGLADIVFHTIRTPLRIRRIS